MNHFTGQKVIVRTYSAGVHFGEVLDGNGKEVLLKDAKRIWRWNGANTLNEIALRGVASTSKISDAVPRILLTEAIEVIPCSEVAVVSLEGATWAK